MIWFEGMVVAPETPVFPAAARFARNWRAVGRKVALGAATGSNRSPNPIGYTRAGAFDRLSPLSPLVPVAIGLTICWTTVTALLIDGSTPFPGLPPLTRFE